MMIYSSYMEYGSNNLAIPRLYICYNYKPNSTDYDERGIGLRYVDEKLRIVIERTYYWKHLQSSSFQQGFSTTIRTL